MKTYCEDYLRRIIHIFSVVRSGFISLLFPFAVPLVANKSIFKAVCQNSKIQASTVDLGYKVEIQFRIISI